jgi:Cof subfamily protein (haloacid dehalogenase superfamily)
MNNKSMQGLLLVTDLDGTLVTDRGVIPERNLEAIERFTGKGGRIAFATGRSVLGTERFAAKVPLNTPSIVYNGGGIYDFKTKTLLWSRYLPQGYISLVKAVKTRFPDVGIEIYSGGGVHYLHKNEHTKAHIALLGVDATDSGLDLLQSNKVLFCGDAGRLLEVSACLEQMEHSGCEFVFSGPIYYEILPEGITKGTALAELAVIAGITPDRIMCIGDYYNDAAMLQAAAVGAVPAGAPEDIKAIAGLVVGPCENGAVADFIEYLEDRYGQ